MKLNYLLIFLPLFLFCCKEEIKNTKNPPETIPMSILNDDHKDKLLLYMILNKWDLTKDIDGLDRLYVSPKLKYSELKKNLGFTDADLNFRDENYSAYLKTELFECHIEFETPYLRSLGEDPNVVMTVHKIMEFKNKRKYKFPSIMLEEDITGVARSGKYDRSAISTILLINDWDGLKCKLGGMYGFASPKMKYIELKQAINFHDTDVKWFKEKGIGVVGNPKLMGLIFFEKGNLPKDSTIVTCRVYNKKELKEATRLKSIDKDPLSINLIPFIIENFPK